MRPFSKIVDLSEIWPTAPRDTEDTQGVMKDYSRIKLPCTQRYQPKTQTRFNGIYLKLPQMSPNTSSLFVCVFLAEIDDPKAPAFAPARLPVDSPHMLLPESGKDGC